MPCWKMVKIVNIIMGTLMNLMDIMPSYGARRLKICRKCDRMKTGAVLGERCGKCGCILKSKVAVESEKCPDGKW